MSAETSSVAPRRVTGTRLYLRRLDPLDISPRYVSWFQDKDWLRYYAGTPWEPTKNALRAQLAQDNLFIYGIFPLGQLDFCIGTVRIGPVHPIHGTSDLVAMIGDPSYRGKGLASEAIRLGNRLAFEAHGVRKLAGGMFAANEASIRAYLRAGWFIEGRLKDHYLVDGEPMDRVLVACFP